MPYYRGYFHSFHNYIKLKNWDQLQPSLFILLSLQYSYLMEPQFVTCRYAGGGATAQHPEAYPTITQWVDRLLGVEWVAFCSCPHLAKSDLYYYCSFLWLAEPGISAAGSTRKELPRRESMIFIAEIFPNLSLGIGSCTLNADFMFRVLRPQNRVHFVQVLKRHQGDNFYVTRCPNYILFPYVPKFIFCFSLLINQQT